MGVQIIPLVVQWSSIWHSPLSAFWPSVLPLVSLRPHLKPRQRPPNTAILLLVVMGMAAMVSATATTITVIPIMVATLDIFTMVRGLLRLMLLLRQILKQIQRLIPTTSTTTTATTMATLLAMFLLATVTA